jgi:hypothetical protein
MNIYLSIRAALTAAAGVAILSACGGYGSSGMGMTAAPTASFSKPAQATTIHLGQSVVLAWSSIYTSSCTASTSSTTGGAFTGTVATSGTQTIAPTATGTVTYTLQCTATASYGNGMVTAHSQILTVDPSILSGLSTITPIGSTLDSIEMGGNPYGLAIAPATAGLITQGDLVACNFNDGATNTQGMGTTIVGLHPSPGATPYRIAQSAQLLGCAALAILPDDSISAAALQANLNPLVAPNGTVNNPFGAHTFGGPWSEAFVAAAGSQPAALYVSNAMTGAIERITLNVDAPMAYVEIAKGFCVSGVPGAVFAPAGLTYDASIDTLYIVDTSSYSVVALAGISTIGADGVVVNGNCGATTPTPALTFSGPSASSASIIASGGSLNAPISAALLADGDLVVANADINGPTTPNLLFEISPAIGFVGAPLQLDTSGTAGALFGLAATVDAQGNQIIYFNDDNANKVMRLTQ